MPLALVNIPDTIGRDAGAHRHRTQFVLNKLSQVVISAWLGQVLVVMRSTTQHPKQGTLSGRSLAVVVLSQFLYTLFSSNRWGGG